MRNIRGWKRHFLKRRRIFPIKRVKLDPVQKEDIDTLWRMQVEAFMNILDKYQDFEMSPPATVEYE